MDNNHNHYMKTSHMCVALADFMNIDNNYNLRAKEDRNYETSIEANSQKKVNWPRSSSALGTSKKQGMVFIFLNRQNNTFNNRPQKNNSLQTNCKKKTAR